MEMSRLQASIGCTVSPQHHKVVKERAISFSFFPSSNLGWGCRINPRLCSSVPVELSSQKLRRRTTSCVLASGSSDTVEGSGESRMTWLSSVEENPMADWIQKGEDGGDMLREECGVVAIFGDPEAGRVCYLALHALQHRGQEGAGMVTADEGTLHAVTGTMNSSSLV